LFDRMRRKLGKPTPEKENATRLPWSLRSWQGSVIRAIIQNGSPLTWKEIQEATGLDEKSLNRALFDLQASAEVYKTEEKQQKHAKYQICANLYSKYSEFYNPRAELIRWICQWKEVKKLDFSMEHEHFFLEGRHLDDFSKELICNAKTEVQTANPFIQDCDLSNTLRDAKKRGVHVQIITRPPKDKYPEHLKKRQEYHLRLIQEGIPLIYEEKVHAKLIVVDRAVAIVSSMNFYAESSAGVSWEVGLVSTDTKVVKSIADAFSRVRMSTSKTREKISPNEAPENVNARGKS